MRDIHDQWVKQYPTDFSSMSGELPSIPDLEQPIRIHHGPSIDDRYLFLRGLGHGQEGSTAVYVDVHTGDEVVVKFFENRARNPIPRAIAHHFQTMTRTWPTEVEAGLLFGSSKNESPFVPVHEYFILQDVQSWSWALVTPLIGAGTLLNLAKQERRHGGKSIDELDLEYRPSLLKMLRGLESLHSADLCHDDVKPDNIFVESNTQWLLGDLGNVRETGHAWHKTASWTRQNKWKDCQMNDVRRAIKSYLWFLRSAMMNAEGFDREFWVAEKSWSRLYWDYVRYPTSIGHLIDGVHSNATATIGARPVLDDAFSSPAELSRDTERELLCTSIPRRLWRRWWRFPRG
ncbi:hypothetical protein CLAFUW4_11113 [Fulvia fulva]|uniref:non-specific serine/threonine protein kinase n=1 Tax=Passalora fulva TaxID=5499 RepID=A0A9Q8PDJ7_PASFU|nr:uncharacterized protein CLAFUR5_10155 [Fulvia fulva]KAK4620004.1 hypothetical protein CLAFUR4_11118 [Fulvia fulva]KAK4620257.1 hypothetical protein CLAFUR0_11124 [Fulvia fulva]UJO20437.1 hypothetical protein CLAFUR5_10155 [Fulvia fulva]WPV17757.1 hypothetical protein CLAFUW4_11113 [Fulvia fulva]WPV31796.1 hypothetical protein CLAFUW7_11109 [Fulvia fulva]